MNNNHLALILASIIIACTIYLKMQVEMRCDGTNFISFSETKAE